MAFALFILFFSVRWVSVYAVKGWDLLFVREKDGGRILCEQGVGFGSFVVCMGYAFAYCPISFTRSCSMITNRCCVEVLDN